MKTFAAFLKMVSVEKSQQYRAEHLEFLAARRAEGCIFAQGRFVDGAGGLVIYRGESEEQIRAIAEQDPYLIHQARELELHEWDMTTIAVIPE